MQLCYVCGGPHDGGWNDASHSVCVDVHHCDDDVRVDGSYFRDDAHVYGQQIPNCGVIVQINIIIR